MNPNSILAMAYAFGRSNPPLLHELEQVLEPPKPAKPQTQADLDRIAAAQAKRERKSRNRKKQQLKAKIDQLAADCPKTESPFFNAQVVYERPPIMRMTAP